MTTRLQTGELVVGHCVSLPSACSFVKASESQQWLPNPTVTCVIWTVRKTCRIWGYVPGVSESEPAGAGLRIRWSVFKKALQVILKTTHINLACVHPVISVVFLHETGHLSCLRQHFQGKLMWLGQNRGAINTFKWINGWMDGRAVSL